MFPQRRLESRDVLPVAGLGDPVERAAVLSLDDFDSRGKFEKVCDDRTEATARVLGHYKIHLNPKDTSLTPHLMRDGYWESWVSVALGRNLCPGMMCVDVGANVGYYTLLMVARGAAKVLAVEPWPDTVALLKKTVDANHLGLVVTVADVAAGSLLGHETLKRYKNKHGSDSFLDSPGYDVTERKGVDIVPVDMLVATWPRVDAIKIDVEGYEQEVWEGLRFTRKRYPELVVCMELHGWAGYDVREFVDRLISEKSLAIVETNGSVTWLLTGAQLLGHPWWEEHNGATVILI